MTADLSHLPPKVPTRVHLRDRLLTLSELAKLPPATPLIDGLIYTNTIAQVSGGPGSYKTMTLVGMSCALAVGQNWEGHRVPKAGTVIYVAAEGAEGLAARIYAWCEMSGVDPALIERRLKTLAMPIQLGDKVDVTEATEMAKELDASLLVLDTRARCTLGMAENDSTEQGFAIEAVETIKAAAGCSVLVVHHTGRSGDHGRGSNAWDGAIWSDLRLKGEDLRCVIHCEKHKDRPSGCDHHFRLIPHTVSEDLLPRLEGETDDDWRQRRSTLVTVQTGDLDDLAGDRRSTRVVLDVIRKSAGTEGLTRSQIVDLSVEHNLGRSTAYEAVGTLVKQALIRNRGTEKRPKYVPAGQASLVGDDA